MAAPPLLALDAERTLLGRVGDAEADAGEEPPAAQHVERGHLLGQDHGVAPGEDEHGGAELHPLGAAGGDGEGDEGIGGG